MSFLADFLAHPLTRGINIDDPMVVGRRRRIIAEKGFLRRIYEEWYDLLRQSLPPEGAGTLVEIGSGAGFAETKLPGLVTSDLFPIPGQTLCLNAARGLPFRADCLQALILVNTFHHLPDPVTFLQEAERCLRVGGVITMIEPWVSAWSSLVYRYLHHEPFFPDAPDWHFISSGPLTGANEALPFLVFHRDRPKFDRLFPKLTLEIVRPIMPFRYLLSGGISTRNLMPEAFFWFFTAFEKLFRRSMSSVGMFAHLVVRKTA